MRGGFHRVPKMRQGGPKMRKMLSDIYLEYIQSVHIGPGFLPGTYKNLKCIKVIHFF